MPANRPGFYGTNEETYYVRPDGRVYLVQGPDMRPGEKFQTCRSIPATAIPLADDLCEDLDVEACHADAEAG